MVHQVKASTYLLLPGQFINAVFRVCHHLRLYDRLHWGSKYSPNRTYFCRSDTRFSLPLMNSLLLDSRETLLPAFIVARGTQLMRYYKQAHSFVMHARFIALVFFRTIAPTEALPIYLAP